MTGTPHLGALRQLNLQQETAWGTAPTGTWLAVPIVDNGWGVKAKSKRYRPNTNYGGDFRRHLAIHHLLEVDGPLESLLWPQAAAFLLGMGLTRDTNGELSSYAANYYTPTDPRQYTGLKADKLTIKFQGSGDAEIRVTLDLIGKLEAAAADLDADDFEYAALDLVPFMFSGCQIKLNDVWRQDLESGTITIANNLRKGPMIWTAGPKIGTLGRLDAQQRAISFESTELNMDDDMNAAIREGDAFTLQLTAYHPLGYALQIQLPCMHVEESAEDGTPDKIVTESPKFEAVADPTSGEDIIWAVELTQPTTLLPELTTPAPTTAGG